MGKLSMLTGSLGAIAPSFILALAAAAPAFLVGHNNGFASARKEITAERRVFINREVILWTMLDESYSGRAELARQFDTVLGASAEAQDAWRRELSTYQSELADARASTDLAFDLLDHLKDDTNEKWAGTPIPRERLCVYNNASCDSPEARAFREGALDIREPELSIRDPGSGDVP